MRQINDNFNIYIAIIKIFFTKYTIFIVKFVKNVITLSYVNEIFTLHIIDIL